MIEKSILPSTWETPQIFRDRLGEKPGRQRAMIAEGHLLLVLHAPPHVDEHERSARFFWRSPDGHWTSTASGKGIDALSRHLDEYQNELERLLQLELAAKSAENYFAILEQLVPLQRAIQNLHQTLQQARQECPDVREIINFRDRAYELERTAEILYNGIKNSLDFVVARRAEEQSQASHRMAVSAHRLNSLVAFFFPIATLTAIFGTNLSHGLEEAPAPGTFYFVIAIGLVLGGVLAKFVNRHRICKTT